MEHPENNERKPLNQKSRDKFKIMSLKVKSGIDYVPELVGDIGFFSSPLQCCFASIDCYDWIEKIVFEWKEKLFYGFG